MKRRFVMLPIVVLGVCLVSSTSSPAVADYPKKPMTIIYPWNPGRAAEIDARAAAWFLESEFGVRALVTDKIGGTGSATTNR